jgi:hypothetical protein
MNLWINAICYQLTWLAAIAGAGRGWWWAGPAAALTFAIVQLARSSTRRADAILIAVACVLGFAIDSLFAQRGLLHYAAAVPFVGFAPVWIVALWASFALTLNHSLAYLKQHLAVAAVLGAIGAPLAYYGAANGWGALAFPSDPVPALAMLSICWAAVTPGLAVCARYLCEHAPAIPALDGAVR